MRPKAKEGKMIVSEKVNQNRRRIWGSFKLSDKSITRFEMKKGEAWFQWGNTQDNLWDSVERVEELTSEWIEKYA